MKITNVRLNQIIKEREELKKLVDESRKNISSQTNKFTEGIKKLGEFHDNYQKELEGLERKMFFLRKEIQLATFIIDIVEKEKIIDIREYLEDKRDQDN